MLPVTTIRPGLLVSLKTQLSGNVTYATRDIEADHVAPDGTRRAKWETDRVVQDPEEHERGIKARGKARTCITSVCAASTFGLLCPEIDRDKLTDAMTEARVIADEFNASAGLTRLTVNVIVGRIAQDDVEAVRAINGEVRDLLLSMERGVQRLDVEAIREACNKATQLGSMLSPEGSARAEAAIKAARGMARRIVKAGEAASVEVDQATLRTIREGRLLFLDLDDATEMQAPDATGRAIDLSPEAIELTAEAPDLTVGETVTARAQATPDIELDATEQPQRPPAPAPSAFELEF